MNIIVSDLKYNIYKNYTIGEAGNITCDFDISRQFIIYVPGFTSQYNGYPTIWVKEALKSIPDVISIFVDYSAYSKVKLNVPNLQGLVPYVYYIGKAVGELLAYNGFIGDNVQVLAHSTGSHVSGQICETYAENTCNKIRRFTCIDPSAPCFIDAKEKDLVVKAGVAAYVEVLHCTNQVASSVNYHGDTDYLFNWNVSVQPGCENGVYLGDLGELTPELCGHYTCVHYWVNSVLNKNLYQVCGSEEVYCDGVCDCPQICGYHKPCRDGTVYIKYTDKIAGKNIYTV